eukprot:TRINITY_DN6196_c0_g1_i4.p1 TRINITY_DN6196_c0_g1~~TRINITY_DN6196_c0_g1_i4.p1  ORF type:complete len:452 (+),score=80.84 TRINITY_DN6196_c0_g1_i4:152-1507(+)
MLCSCVALARRASHSVNLAPAASSSSLFGSNLILQPAASTRSSLFQALPQTRKRFISYVPSDYEMGYALITPKSLAKSHTGGIVARLLSTPGLELVGARMLKPSDSFRTEFVSIMQEAAYEDQIIEPYEEALIRYVEKGLSDTDCNEEGIENKLMMLLFAGPKARTTLIQVIGDNVPPPAEYGRTIRGTYGDYSLLFDGTVVTFEPAVLTAHTEASNRKVLALLAKYAESDVFVQEPGPKEETVLVMIKPDNFLRPSALPGHIIDQFGQTGLKIVAARVYQMSLDQAREFYGFLEDIFVEKLRGVVENKLRQELDNAFDFKITDHEYKTMSDVLKRRHARVEVNKIIQYMTGLNPDVPLNEQPASKAKCFGLLYQGPNAVDIIRTKLGSTDPKKALAGTVRSDYGHDLMRNGAHASDSVASALRERKIVGLLGKEKSHEKAIIEHWLQHSK